MCRVEIILIVFIFLWSLFILFFLFGEKKDSMWESIYLFISWDKKTSSSSSSSSKKWRLSREKKKKLDSLFILHTLYKAFTAGVVGVQKGRRRRL